MLMRPNDRIALVGATGSGKTYLAGKLLRSVSRLIVIDPKNTLGNKWGLSDWSKRSKKALFAGDPLRVRFSPEPGEEWRYEEILSLAYEAENVMIYIDEVYGIVEPGRKPPKYLTADYTRGRELGIGMIAATQRPSWVPLFILSEANWYICFRLMMDEDRRRMSKFMGSSVLAVPPDKYGFYVYSVEWSPDDTRYYRKVT